MNGSWLKLLMAGNLRMHQSINTVNSRSYWVFNPVIDSLFICNCLWPVLLLPGLVSGNETSPIQFIHAYLLSSPHRWITLFLVVSDSSRRVARQNQMALTAVSFAVLILILKIKFDYLICLLWIDYTWNAFHFAAQHSGVLAIYCRKNNIIIPSYFKWLLRIILTIVILMVPINSLNTNLINHLLQIIAVIGLPVMLLLALLLNIFSSIPSAFYFISFVSIYGGILMSNVFHLSGVANGLLLASSVFHSTEYFAIVSRYVITRDQSFYGQKSTSLLRMKITGFMIFIALILVGLQSFDPEVSAAINLWAAFLHYSFDAWIWKLKEPKNSSLLTNRVENA